jgi:putative sterol carrier protein
VLPVKGELTHPSALVLLKDLQTTNDFLAGKLDTFVAAVTGDVQIRGRVAMVDTLALVLDRVGKYLQPEPTTAVAG